MTTYHPLSDAERRDMEHYGPCEVCDTARTFVLTLSRVDGRPTHLDMKCPSCDGVTRHE